MFLAIFSTGKIPLIDLALFSQLLINNSSINQWFNNDSYMISLSLSPFLFRKPTKSTISNVACHYLYWKSSNNQWFNNDPYMMSLSLHHFKIENQSNQLQQCCLLFSLLEKFEYCQLIIVPIINGSIMILSLVSRRGHQFGLGLGCSLKLVVTQIKKKIRTIKR